MQIPAAYVRQSGGNGQHETSLEDQKRRCQEIAEREGLTLDPRYIFSDDAVTGKAEGMAKRHGYHRLIDALDERVCTVVIADELSRLTRDPEEGGRLLKYATKRGVRFITHDGLDTSRPGWKAMWMLKLMTSTMEVDGTSSRTTRGMVGQLLRGYHVAQPPYGYRAAPDVSPSGRVLGTKWSIHEPEAKVVRQMYMSRYNGLSLGDIAQGLNRAGVPPPGEGRKNAAGHWRPGTVFQMLRNSIYRGTFTWNASGYSKTKARETNTVIEELPFAREHLRIIGDDCWHSCNAPKVDGQRSRGTRGGGKKAFSGLVRCGDCNGLLSVGSNQGMNCPGCASDRRVGARKAYMGYTSVSAAKQALTWVLRQVFTGEFRQELDRRVQARLTSGPDKELAELSATYKALKERIERIQEYMLNPAVGPAIWQPKLEEATRELEGTQFRLERLRSTSRVVTAREVQAQLGVDPLPLLSELLDGAEEPYKVRTTLQRLLARFQFVRKLGRYQSVFRLALRPGVSLAEASGTETLDSEEVEFEVTVSTSAHRPVVWRVSGCLVPRGEQRN